MTSTASPLRSWLAVAAALLALPACTSKLTPSSRVVRSTAIAARTTVVADPTRSSPRPGEDVQIRLLLAHPDLPPPVAYGFIACIAEATRYGEPSCAGAPVGFFFPDAPAAEDPVLDLTVPDVDALGEADSLLLLGSLCFDGPINTDTDAAQPCADPDGSGELVFYRLPVVRDDQENHHPAIASVTLDGERWDAAGDFDAPLVGCATEAGLPQVSAGREDPVEIGLVEVEGSRETYVTRAGDPPEDVSRTEELQITHLATVGQFERRFSFIDEVDPEVLVEWEPDEDEDPPGAEGRRVRTWFVMRDLRGGVDVAMLDFCLVP